jgi:hypothetical protein
MKNLIKIVVAITVFMPCLAMAEDLSMKWGLENTWSYIETSRGYQEDGAYYPETKGKKYRSFAFNNNPKVVDPMLKCFDRHFMLWNQYQNEIARRGGSAKPDRKDFERFKSERDPTCDQHAKQQAPVLYFDFVAKSSDQFVLEAIEITTLQFSEYKGGGFFKEEAWYDIVLSHNQGTKRYDVTRRLVFSGHGRCELRFWSDNYYDRQGWISPMGEYMIDIKFIFSTGGKQVSISTGPFKIDV